jgi:sugar O-acyltransferase (sialic acid O-acetyltransferase NeuD family)
MFKEKVVVIGAGGHAQSCIDVIEANGQFKIMGLIGSKQEVGKRISGYSVFGTDEDLPKLASEIKNAVIGVGQIDSSDIRRKIFINLREIGFNLPVVISPRAYISKSAQIGSATVVMHHALVNAGVRIGENCIINSKANIEHDSIIESDCHISTGAIVNGDCLIGRGSFLGSGSVVMHGCTIGENSIIGMLTSVRSDISANSIYIGEKTNES